ncbi:methyltransferase [Legionella hackeliae]|uniref:Putative methyltransferase n=1 Tax=Legionella hackeliae TaxID=449 RepID=A0A0A8UXJ1_LEGHA|nr:methyltransferase [Legionella hackeliae]KTD12817.1 methyltransferase [Legionella hackeliae]CEK12241.1 putative methyltransferase [Legionella hackeliae]STX49028.1 methyltransferase [Legionella hackeliae]
MIKRSQEKELIDLGPDFYNQAEYKDCLKKLFQVNKVLGIFRSTRKLLKRHPKQATLLDIGCGGGLFLLNLSQHFPEMRMLGIDINEEAIVDAQKALKEWQTKNPSSHLSFQTEHFEYSISNNNFDILLATLLCHHLSDEELVLFLQQSYNHAKQVVIINDLHRHWLAYWLYAFISPWLFRNRLITHDGLISIKRGFTRAEWKTLLAKANIANYHLKWCWPFRWQLILRK